MTLMHDTESDDRCEAVVDGVRCSEDANQLLIPVSVLRLEHVVCDKHYAEFLLRDDEDHSGDAPGEFAERMAGYQRSR